jgi:hypothetical protein
MWGHASQDIARCSMKDVIDDVIAEVEAGIQAWIDRP